MALVNGASGGALGQLDVALSREDWSYAVPDGAFARKIKALVAQLSTPSTAWAAGDVAARHHDSSMAVDFYVLAGGKLAGQATAPTRRSTARSWAGCTARRRKRRR